MNTVHRFKTRLRKMKELQIDTRVHSAMKKHNRVCQSKEQKDCLPEDLLSEESDVEDDVWVTEDELTAADR